MSYLARIYTNQASAEGATVTLFDRGIEQYLAPVYYDPYNSEGTYRTLEDWTEFGVELEPGYEFVRWVYRVGSETAEVQYSERNPFVYRDMEYIVIRPEVQYTGGGNAVKVAVEFDTDQIYRIRLRHYNENGELTTTNFYAPGEIYVEPETDVEVMTFTLQDAYDGQWPGYCEGPDGTIYEVRDANGEWNQYFIYIPDYSGVCRFYIGDGGGGGDFGDFVERWVYINGQRYTPYIFDGSWREYTAYIAE